MRSGFSLIQLCILLTVTSLLFVTFLPSMDGMYMLAAGTSGQLNAVLLALRQYQAANGALPCPGDATLPEGSSNYGVAAANPAGGCSGGTPAANYTDTVNHIAIGMVPVRALKLPDRAALDGYGRKITYAVDTGATSCYSGTLQGAITVTDNGVPASSIAVLVSHGGNGHGAFLSLPGNNGAAGRLNAGSTDSDELANAHLNAAFAPVTPLSGFVAKAATATFDDIVAYKSASFILNAAPATEAALLPQMAPPANGTYYTGEPLVFTLTFPSVVVVTGAPRLVLTIGGITRYAAYASGSGTKTLQFSYTVQSTDAAPAGIGMASTIDPNSGTLSSSCLAFTPPNLAGVLIKTLTLYVTDYTNNRVEWFSSSGGYLGQFSGSGFIENVLDAIIGITFNHPYQIAVDTSGHVWVSDLGNDIVEEYSAAGTYISQLGLILGILPGEFINPTGLAFDSAGNVWVSDSGNNRIEKFSSSGAYLSQFGSYGSGNGQFSLPVGLAFDSSGNLWAADSNNNRLEKFSSSGSYLAQFGSYGTTAGKLSNPCCEAIDSVGNIWVSDSGNNRIEKFSSSGAYLSQFGSYGSGNGQFSGPGGIAIDASGYLWVVDSGNNRIEKFDSSGNYMMQFGSTGTGNGQFKKPVGIALHYQ